MGSSDFNIIKASIKQAPGVRFSKVPNTFVPESYFSIQFVKNGIKIFSRQTSPARVVNVRF